MPGTELGLEEYFADFEDRFWQSGFSWKLECRQEFREPGVPSWEAMAGGDWGLAYRLAEEMRPGISDHQLRLDAEKIVQRRVRVVELPLTDYLRWELYVLRIRAELGERIRVVPPAGPMPEIIVLGEEVVYQVRYDELGVVTGAKLVDDPDLAVGCIADLEVIWRGAEELSGFLDRTEALA